MRPIVVPVAAVAALAACAPVTPPLWAVHVAEAGPKLKLAARAPDCAIEFHRTRGPQRTYDEIALLHYQGEGGLPDAQEAIRAKACALGADAVVVTGEFSTGSMWNTMSGTAVSYPELREQHRAEGAAREAEGARARAEKERALAEAREAAAREVVADRYRETTLNPPPGLEPARLRRPEILRARPDRQAAQRALLEAGSEIWIDPSPSRWRRTWTLRGQTGWLEDPEVDLVGPAAQ